MAFLGGAYLAQGDESSLDSLYAFLKEQGITVRGNSDVYVRIYGALGVDDARALRERASLGALGKNPRVFVIVADSMTHEAQNALLKTLEEPPADAAFFLIVPSPETLLPTLRSRTQPLSLKGASSVGEAKDFLRSSKQERLNMVGELLEKGDDDKRDTGAILAFLASLERSLATHPESLEAVYRARKYAGDRGALLKPLLEQVALLLPVIK